VCLEAYVFAVVRTGGKQYRVQEGRLVRVDRLAGEPGDTIELGDVLVMGDGEDVTVGAPTVSGARVLGTIRQQGRAQKVVVFRYKAKTRSRKKTGHRQPFTEVLVDDILAAGQEPKPKQAKAAPEAAEEKPKARGRRKSETAAAAATAEPAGDQAEAKEASVEAETTADAPAPKQRRSRKKAE
jgi:large subunit ribosomal protein L21